MGREAAHADRSADDLAHEVAGARIGPEEDLADGPAIGADRHRRAPLPGDRHRVQPVAVGAGAGDRLAARLDQARPPLDGVLGGAAVEPDLHVHGTHGGASHLALGRDDGYLGAAVAQVDREDPVLGHVRKSVRREERRAWRRAP